MKFKNIREYGESKYRKNYESEYSTDDIPMYRKDGESQHRKNDEFDDDEPAYRINEEFNHHEDDEMYADFEAPLIKSAQLKSTLDNEHLKIAGNIIWPRRQVLNYF